MFKQKIKLPLLLLVLLMVLVSCTKETDVFSANNPEAKLGLVQKDSNSVSTSEAKSFAENIFKSGSSKYSKNGVKKKVNEVKTFSADSVNSLFHIINYEGGGFLILAGDKRSYPVLAFSNENNFDTGAEAYPGLLVEWLRNQGEFMKGLDNDTINRSEFHKLWNVEEIEGFITSVSSKRKGVKSLTAIDPFPNYPFNTPVLESSYGPLLSTNWSQGVGYNNYAPNQSCSNYSNGRTPTGCVATAMSQIMKYYQHPSSYNWSIMPNSVYSSTVNSSGANEISRLMRDAGNSVGMDWGCNGSGAETSDSVNALKNSFGYSSATYSSTANYTTMESELASNNPVILRGGEKVVKWLIFNVYDNGHAWVCDGIKKYRTKIQLPDGPPNPGGPGNIVLKSSFSFHMNWGWGGYQNGWYSTWENDAGDFTYKKGMVYNIRE